MASVKHNVYHIYPSDRVITNTNPPFQARSIIFYPVLSVLILVPVFNLFGPKLSKEIRINSKAAYVSFCICILH